MKVGIGIGDMRNTAAEARRAEELGFDYLSSGEHLFFHGPVPNALVTLAAAAGATTRIRLLSSVSLVPLYPPALFAKLTATLDVVSGGRLELGIGAGGEYPPEFEAAGVDPATRFRRIDETLDVLRLLGGGGRVDFDGEFTSLRGVTLDPLPVQAPTPPLWLVGRKPAALRRVGRRAEVWMPYMVTPEMVRDGLDVVRRAAEDAGRPPEAVSAALFAWTCIDTDGAWARETGIRVVSRVYNQDFDRLADRYLLLGTPDQALSRLAAYADAGVTRVVITIAAPAADRTRVLGTIAAMLPALRAL
jgi:probable F420-dependent oxidoreductase